MDINNVMLIGRLTRPADVKYTPNGVCVAKFSLAVNRRKDKGGNEQTDYFDVTLFGFQAEKLQRYLVKGKQVAVSGRLQQDRWEKDGQRFSKVSIVAETLQLLGGTKAEESHADYMAGGYEEVPF